MVISKELFVKSMNEIKATFEFQEKLNDFYSQNGADGFIFQPDCTDTALGLLHFILGGKDEGEWIDYYCFELDFGKKAKDYTVTFHGKEFILDTPEALYDFLMQEC